MRYMFFFFKKRTNSIKACHSADGQMLSMPFNCEVHLTEKGANNCLVAVKDFILFFLSPSGKLPETLLFLPHHCSEIEGFQIRCHGTHGANILLTIYNQKCLLTLQLSRMRGSLMVSPGQGSHTGWITQRTWETDCWAPPHSFSWVGLSRDQIICFSNEVPGEANAGLGKALSLRITLLGQQFSALAALWIPWGNMWTGQFSRAES